MHFLIRTKTSKEVNAVKSSISSLDHQNIYTNRKICHDHFEERYLIFVAVPTLHMPDLTSALKPEMSIPRNLVAESEMSIPSDLVDDPETSIPRESIADPEMSIPSDLVDEPETSIPRESIADPEMSIPRNLDADEQSSKSKREKIPFLDDKTVLMQRVNKLMKTKVEYARRLKKTQKLAKHETFQKIMNKLTNHAFISMSKQFRKMTKRKMTKKFTVEEKIMALSVYNQGLRYYTLLSKLFDLPSPRTLTMLIKRAEIRAGINEKLFKVLQKKIKKCTTKSKLCILLFGQIAITPRFKYNQRRDISGFVTHGTTAQKYADNVLVFMIRGILKNYKQPVAYTFCVGRITKEERAMLIKEIIQKLHGVGLRVLATVCDHSTTNISCINHMISETKAAYLNKNQEFERDIFEVEGKEIIPLYDPPHLIKGVRNNLLENNLKFSINGQCKIAKWEHIIKLHEENPSYNDYKLLKKLSIDHVYPKNKTKVEIATQVFSLQVAAMLGSLATFGILPLECRQTAEALKFFDELFDSFNGSKNEEIDPDDRSRKPLLFALAPKSRHNAFWVRAKIVLGTMRFLKDGNEFNVPSVNKWIHNINNIEYLKYVLLRKYGVRATWMRRYNLDPLENLFAVIRSHGCRNISPSPEGFEIAFASSLISNSTGLHSLASNCEPDGCKNMFKSMKELL